jgi:hypothetical protein
MRPYFILNISKDSLFFVMETHLFYGMFKNDFDLELQNSKK